ncbi:MAG: DUF3307 domain-containing protein [Elusimicrobiaceae bacterium]
MLIFWRLLFAHLLADFTLQTNSVAKWKRESRSGMLIHCLTHVVCSIVMVWPYINDSWFNFGGFRFTGWMAVGVIFLTHYLQDRWRVYAIKALSSSDGTLYFIWDQLVHIGVIFALSPSGIGDGSVVEEKWVVYLCMFVVVTHGITVFTYFIEKALYNEGFPGFDKKYFGILQRVALWFFFFIPGWHWAPWFLAWLGYTVYLYRQRIVDLSRAGFYVGLGITVLSGVIARNLYLYLPG